MILITRNPYVCYTNTPSLPFPIIRGACLLSINLGRRFYQLHVKNHD